MLRNSLAVVAVATCGFLCLGTDDLSAQTLLRWQLKPGETFTVAVAQQTSSQVAFSGKQTTTAIDLAMDLTWQVTAAGENGIAIKQTIQRLVFKLNSPKAGSVEYDSAQQANPTGPARDVAAAVKPLLGAEIELTMDDRGQVKAVKPIGEVAEKLLAAGKEEEGVFSTKAIQQLLRQPLAILPEKPVAMGDSWTNTAEIDAAAGRFKQETTSMLAGEVEQAGQKLLKIEQKWTLTPADPAAKPSLTLKSHQQTGRLLFDAAAGRLASAEQTQKLVTERPYRETTIVVTLSSTQKTTVKAAEK